MLGRFYVSKELLPKLLASAPFDIRSIFPEEDGETFEVLADDPMLMHECDTPPLYKPKMQLIVFDWGEPIQEYRDSRPLDVFKSTLAAGESAPPLLYEHIKWLWETRHPPDPPPTVEGATQPLGVLRTSGAIERAFERMTPELREDAGLDREPPKFTSFHETYGLYGEKEPPTSESEE